MIRKSHTLPKGKAFAKYEIISLTGAYLGQIWIGYDTLFQKITPKKIRRAIADTFPCIKQPYNVEPLQATANAVQPFEHIRTYNLPIA